VVGRGKSWFSGGAVRELVVRRGCLRGIRKLVMLPKEGVGSAQGLVTLASGEAGTLLLGGDVFGVKDVLKIQYNDSCAKTPR